MQWRPWAGTWGARWGPRRCPRGRRRGGAGCSARPPGSGWCLVLRLKIQPRATLLEAQNQLRAHDWPRARLVGLLLTPSAKDERNTSMNWALQSGWTGKLRKENQTKTDSKLHKPISNFARRKAKEIVSYPERIIAQFLFRSWEISNLSQEHEFFPKIKIGLDFDAWVELAQITWGSCSSLDEAFIWTKQISMKNSNQASCTGPLRKISMKNSDQFIEYRPEILSPCAMAVDCIVHRTNPVRAMVWSTTCRTSSPAT